MSAKIKPRPRKRTDLSNLEIKLTPERLALYKRTLEIRDKIGPVSTKVSDLVREMRGEEN